MEKERPLLKGEQPLLNPKEVMSELARRWQSLSEDFRAPFVEAAAALKAEHDAAISKEPVGGPATQQHVVHAERAGASASQEPIKKKKKKKKRKKLDQENEGRENEDE